MAHGANGDGAASLAVTNDEGQFAIWPAAFDLPRGWRRTGIEGTRSDCADGIAERWTDMRPLSLKRWLADAGGRRRPVGRSVVAAIERRGRVAPSATAVVAEDDALTYRALNVRANRLARHLESLGAGPESVVGVLLGRTLDLPVTLLAVLKTGAAYLPLDPGHPVARTRYMLADSAASMLVSTEALSNDLQIAIRCVELDRQAVPIEQQAGEDASVGVIGSSLAYVVYTSGSTGKPKGVMIPHAGVLDHLTWRAADARLDERDRILQTFSVAFDPSVWDIFAPLLSGAVAVMTRPDGHRDPAYLAHMLRAERITAFQTVPPVLRILLEDENLDRLPALRHVYCGGETLPPDVRDRFVRTVDATLHNVWGATEATIGSADWRCSAEDDARFVPIGRPIGAASVRVLGDDMRPADDRSIGELHIGGTGLARGYLGRPDLTAQRFVPDPFGPAGTRLYKTGDRGRMRDGAAIEFVGRLDAQVQVRGLRVEPEEVAHELASHPAVRDVVVLPEDDRHAEVALVAYVVVRADSFDEAAVRQFLCERVPAQMVPSAFVVLDELPLTVNGKVDRDALRAAFSRRRSGVSATLPRTPLEALLLEIWMEHLDARPIGVHDDFFASGGHSLLATRVIKRLREASGVDVPVSAIFEAPTIAMLAEAVEVQRDAVVNAGMSGTGR